MRHSCGGGPRNELSMTKKSRKAKPGFCPGLSMQKNPTSHFAFFNPHVLIALLFCATVACSILNVPLLCFSQPKAPSNVPDRTLTIAERVAYQRAIEDVYWRHRIWPKERPDPKPSLDAVMSPRAAGKEGGGLPPRFTGAQRLLAKAHRCCAILSVDGPDGPAHKTARSPARTV